MVVLILIIQLFLLKRRLVTNKHGWILTLSFVYFILFSDFILFLCSKNEEPMLLEPLENERKTVTYLL